MPRESKSYLFVVIFAWLVLLWSVNTAPSFHLPLIIEFLTIGLAGLYLSFRRAVVLDNKVRLALCGLGLVIAVNLWRSFVSTHAIEIKNQVCTSLPGLIFQIECYFQAGAELNPIPRQFLYHVTAAIVFLLGISLRKYSLQRVFIFTGVIFVFLSIFLSRSGFYAQQHWLGSVYAESRFSSLFENPTWIWPYLVPCILSGFLEWVEDNGVLSRSIAFISILIIGAFLLLTQQRGAFLVFSASMLVLGKLFFEILPKKIRLPAATVTLGLGLLLILVLHSSTDAFLELKKLTSTIGVGDRLLQISFTETSRTKMWIAALSAMDGYWLIGHGYGSWYKNFSAIGLVNNVEAYDTAHNFFVQLVFESGLLVTFLVTTVFLIFIVCVWMRVKNDRSHKLVFGLSIILYGLILSVQEVDFVRSVYYTNSLFLGWYISGRLGTEIELSKKFRAFFFIPTILILVFSVLLVQMFSLGGYQYEADFRNSFAPKVRWFKPKGTITFVKIRDVDRDRFALYKVQKSFSLSAVLSGEEDEVLQLKSPEDEHYLPIQERFFLDKPDWLEAESSDMIDGRHLSIMVSWPPLITRLPFVEASGVNNWETTSLSDGRAVWCKKICRIQFRKCPSKLERRLLRIIASRDDLHEDDPLTVKVSSGPETKFISFTKKDEIKEIRLVDPRVSIESSRIFKNEADSREKGIFLLDSKCVSVISPS